MKQRKLERKLIEERNVRKLDEENRKLETVRKLEDVKLEGFQSEFADKIRKLEEGNENEERKLETNRKLDGDCMLERKLEVEIDENTRGIEDIRHRSSTNIQQKIKPSIHLSNVVKIKSQIEEKIRKQQDIERKLVQNSPINKRKLNEENKRKLNSSMRKVVQSKMQKGKIPISIPTTQRSLNYYAYCTINASTILIYHCILLYSH